MAARTPLERKLVGIWERRARHQPDRDPRQLLRPRREFGGRGAAVRHHRARRRRCAAARRDLQGADDRAPGPTHRGRRRGRALDLAGSDPARWHAAADLLRPRRGRHRPAPRAAGAPAGSRPAVLRPAVARPVRRRIAAEHRRGHGHALPVRDAPGQPERPVVHHRVLLRGDRGLRVGQPTASHGRGCSPAGQLQRPEPDVDPALGLVWQPTLASRTSTCAGRA